MSDTFETIDCHLLDTVSGGTGNGNPPMGNGNPPTGNG